MGTPAGQQDGESGLTARPFIQCLLDACTAGSEKMVSVLCVVFCMNGCQWIRAVWVGPGGAFLEPQCNEPPDANNQPDQPDGRAEQGRSGNGLALNADTLGCKSQQVQHLKQQARSNEDSHQPERLVSVFESFYAQGAHRIENGY